MTTDARSAEQGAGQSLLGPWVEAHEEPCGGGRDYQLLLNHRTNQAIVLSETEGALYRGLAAGRAPGDGQDAAAFLADLREHGFLADSPPAASGHRALRLSLTRLELCWTGAGRLVQLVHARGARHLFHPAAVAAQVLLALAGAVAVAVAVLSGQHFQLRVSPGQVPVVLGLSLAAIGVHEFAHALVVVHHRRRVDGAGLRLHLGTPAFYVESASALLLPRRTRLVQAAAGVWAEWQFTSLAALWLWWHPGAFPAALLHRFVILNAATIATNLLPFTGLDGAWLLADAVKAPDLAIRARGAFTRLLIARAAAGPVGPGDRALAVYSALNGVVAAGLLGTAVFFWYQLFGGVVAALLHHGPGGWLVLAAAAVIVSLPACTAGLGWLQAAGGTARELRAAVLFRVQWRWRVPATRRLAGPLAGALAEGALSGAQLGVIAGHLQRTRLSGPVPARLAAPGYGVVRAGTVTAVTPHGTPVTLAAGGTWDPSWRLTACRRATLVHLSAAALGALLRGAECSPAT